MMTTRRRLNVSKLDPNAERSHGLFASRMPWRRCCGQHTTQSQPVDQQHLDGRWIREENDAKDEAKQNLQGSMCKVTKANNDGMRLTTADTSTCKDRTASSKIVYIATRTISS